jgi:DNA-binding winged helix-turn-helix (wHTH) protein
MNRIRFGTFEAGLRDGSLRKRGQVIRLQEKPFQALVLLLENAGEVVTREGFRDRLWPPGTHVEFDDNLNAAIKRLREALCDSAENPCFIETVPRRGYRFIAPIERIDEVSTVAPAAPHGRWARAIVTVALLALSMTAASHHLSSPARPYRLTVLPFANLGSSEQQFFADGITSEVSSQLRRLYPQRLVVIKSAGSGPLDAGYCVRGSIDQRVLTAELIRTHDHTRLWTATFRLPLQEVFISGEIGQRVAR